METELIVHIKYKTDNEGRVFINDELSHYTIKKEKESFVATIGGNFKLSLPQSTAHKALLIVAEYARLPKR